MEQSSVLHWQTTIADGFREGTATMNRRTRALRSIFEVTGYPPTSSFEEEIDQLWKYRVRGIHKNSGPRSRTLIRKMYSVAAEMGFKIRQISGRFDPYVYKDSGVVAAFDKCVEAGVEMEVIVSDEEFLRNKIDFCEKVVNFATVHKAFGERLPHIITLGEEGSVYRAEPNPHDLTRSADFSFNCPEYGSILVSKFDAFTKSQATRLGIEEWDSAADMALAP